MGLSRRSLLAAGGAVGVVAATASTTAAATASGQDHGRVRTGFERLAADGYALLAA